MAISYQHWVIPDWNFGPRYNWCTLVKVALTVCNFNLGGLLTCVLSSIISYNPAKVSSLVLTLSSGFILAYCVNKLATLPLHFRHAKLRPDMWNLVMIMKKRMNIDRITDWGLNVADFLPWACSTVLVLALVVLGLGLQEKCNQAYVFAHWFVLFLKSTAGNIVEKFS